MAYALRIHESCASELSGNDSRMSGKAMLTIVTSRNVMNTPTAVTNKTCQRRAIRHNLLSERRQHRPVAEMVLLESSPLFPALRARAMRVHGAIHEHGCPAVRYCLLVRGPVDYL